MRGKRFKASIEFVADAPDFVWALSEDCDEPNARLIEDNAVVDRKQRRLICA
jgi:hypothetical protein